MLYVYAMVIEYAFCLTHNGTVQLYPTHNDAVQLYPTHNSAVALAVAGLSVAICSGGA